ncbi:MAG TPA: GNAT family N-acetyltransferase [Thiolapillus brandeum]|uniref:GNAT family N-acetyltransferase n=1 Tax=Thiolapillus brandeum TaxID=1076588 RepID=A0A831WB34_9GAMM|nr:GNAT family N-acetyltransferase [Thiolapillus brandeum]
MNDTPTLQTDRTILKIPGPDDAALMLGYYLENREHLSPWEPERTPAFYTLAHWEKLLRDNLELVADNTGFRFAAFDHAHSEVLGICNITNVVYGPFQACNLGYSIARKHEGKGLMTEILEAGIRFAFQDLGLHRIMANHLPCNERSARLLQRLGFEREGYAKSYLKISGRWEDHVLTALVHSDQVTDTSQNPMNIDKHEV